jgi:hypothetical protein
MDAKCLVLLTRISVGSLHLTDPVDSMATLVPSGSSHEHHRPTAERHRG